VNSQKPREIAVRVLLRAERVSDYIEDLLAADLAQAGLTGADRALAQELVFGVTRWKTTLDWLIAQKTEGRVQKVPLQILLRLGLYQMFWLERIPDHATVHETVEMAKRLGFGARAGFVNAVLRGYAREREPTCRRLAELRQTDPALGFSHPKWLFERWAARWGRESSVKLLEWDNTPPKLYARLNTLKATASKLVESWRQEGIEALPRRWEWAPEDLIWEVKSLPSVALLPSFQQGFFYIQDPSTLLAVQQLAPRAGERILDLCAAPGGKTTFIAQRMQNNGQILALDVQPSRLERVRENCARLGVACVETGLVSEDTNHSRELFDRVLVDAPCSNTGVMRRRVDLRWRIRLEEIARLRVAQLGLLRKAAAQVRPGGVLVYSTCSLEPQENAEVIHAFLGDNPKFQLQTERELIPFLDEVDGAYVALMVQED
jgi:16S rRNA (cytosine967-C5)-methyltransferase